MTALRGVRVVELARPRIAFAGKLLADMGADVVLVEPPGGCPSRGYPPFVDDEPGTDRSLYWWHYNTSKRALVLDLDAADDLAAFLRLVDRADVLLESEPTTRLAQLGVDRGALRARNENLLHVAVTPYGRDDPRSDLPEVDLTILAAGGPPWSCGYDDHDLPPVRGWGNQGYHTACHFALMSILTGLLGRDSGGQFIDVSMAAACSVTTEAASYTHLVAGETVQRQTGRHAAVAPTGETQMRCGDGRYANTGVPPRRPEEFARLLAWLRESGLEAELPEAVFVEMGANWEGPFDLSLLGKDDTITAIFGAGRDAMRLLASRSSAQAFFVGCQRAGLAAGPVNAPEEAFEDEHFIARGFQVPVEHAELGRTLRYPGAPYLLPASPWAISRRAPTLDEHREEILAELLQP
ncbi:MAG: CoA transferase [Pseudomonadota bacterium]